MSQYTERSNTGQQLFVEYDLGKIFVRENRYSKGNYTNSTYDEVNLDAGTVLGRVAATGKLVIFDSAASDGSQYPVGILADNYTIAEGETQEVAFCNYGDVVEEKLVFQNTDDLDTVVEDKTVRDRIGSDTVGVRLVSTTQNTISDNY